MRSPKQRRRRRTVIGLWVAAAALFVLGAGSIATAGLGGLSTNNFGVEAGSVGACDADGVAAEVNPTYDAGDGRLEVASVDISGIAAGCIGQTLSITLTNSADASVGTGSLTVAGATETVTVAASPAADVVTGIAVAIAS